MAAGIAPRLTFLASALLSTAAAGAGPSGKWLGQDGHDVVGYSPARAGNEYQDVHVRLSGLPPRREVVHAKLAGLGGDEWQYKGPPSSWLVEVERKPGSAAADLYFEPCRKETGRPFELNLKFDDGSTAGCWIDGGKADPDLRTPATALKVSWVGQDRNDRLGPGPAVGPDGFQDIHLVIERLATKVEARTLAVAGPGGAKWQAGVNPEGLGNAELIRRPDDASKADLFLAADRDRAGQSLVVTVAYADGKKDRAKVVAGRADPALRMPKPAAPSFPPNSITARWVGQGDDGKVRIALDRLPANRPVAAAALADSVRGYWSRRVNDRVPFEPEPYGRPLDFKQEGRRAELAFVPYRDEAGATLTLRLAFADGKSSVVRVPGGACDPARIGAKLPETATQAKPGDDLNDLANRFGTVRLKAGDYPLGRPLVLEHPVAILGAPGARLVFTQGAGEPAWSAAIKVHAGPTTLDGFAVRFAGPVRWAEGVDYGPAVIGSTDNRDAGPHPGPRAGIVVTHLDLETPPAAHAPEEAPRLIRLATADNGRIERNTLRGGPIELTGGPWRVAENEHRGTPPGTYSFAILSAHRTHDLVVRKNRARPEEPSGKVWRFLVLTESGSGDVIEENTVQGVGPRDGDPGPNRNSPEIVLTESYRLHFEGTPAATSADGRVVVIPAPQADQARTGDVVAILSGPAAGRWARVAQAIDARTYLLDEPLAIGDGAISIATGFVGETFRGNAIDARGGTVAAPLVLGGNHFGLKVLDNRILGGGESLKIVATPTESPAPWGWSHAPMFGLRIEGNVIEDAVRDSTLAVEHGERIKSTRGRLYLTATLRDNAFRWTAPGLAGRRKDRPLGLTIGDSGSLDLHELVVAEQGTRAEVPPGTPAIEPVRAVAGWINGRPMRDGRPLTPPDVPRLRGPKLPGESKTN